MHVVSCPDPASQSPKKGGLVSIDAFLGPNTFRDLKIGITNQITEQPIKRACDVSRAFNMEVAVPRFGACTRARNIDTAIASAFSALGYDKPTRVQEESIKAFVSAPVAGKAYVFWPCHSFMTA